VAVSRIYRYNEVNACSALFATACDLMNARGDMAALLSKAGKDLTVTVLLDALQQTKDFELSMAKKFGTSVGHLPGPRGVHFDYLPVTRHPPGDITDANSTFAANHFVFRTAHGRICTAPRQVSSSCPFLVLPHTYHTQSCRRSSCSPSGVEYQGIPRHEPKSSYRG
jgi:hypothetical protein